MKPSLKKPGDFTVAEGHGHPLVGSYAHLVIKMLGNNFLQIWWIFFVGHYHSYPKFHAKNHLQPHFQSIIFIFIYSMKGVNMFKRYSQNIKFKHHLLNF
jgi:hypothetical protein